MDKIIEKALDKAPRVKEGVTGRTGAPLSDGMVLYIEYHTVGKTNVCDYYCEMTSEHFDWKMHDCKDNREWRAYLNRQLWREYRMGLKN